MQLENFYLMRHEFLLMALAIFVLIFEVYSNEKRTSRIIPITIGLFSIITVVGFLPMPTGVLFGGMYQSTELQIFMKNVLNIGVLIILIQSASWLKLPENEGKISEYFVLIFSSLIGMNFMISSGDFLMFYIGLELATIPIAILAAYERTKNKSVEAGIKLLLSSAISSGILLYGLSMIYGMYGTIYFADLATIVKVTPLMVLSLIFFISGMAFKISLVPFHLWTADVYEGSPINVTSFLSVISKGAAAFIFTIILFTVFKSLQTVWTDVIYALSILTMTIGNLFAIRQKNMKRFLAFSSIAQAGFILLGILNANTLGMSSVVYFVLIYIFSNLGAFGVVNVISMKMNKESMDDYDGLYKTNPKLSLLMMLALFSLAGIPPVAGFFGKFFLFTAAAQNGYYWLVFIAVLNATISLYYYLLVVKAMFINKNENPLPYFRSDNYSRVGLLMCVAGIFAIGLIAPIFEMIQYLSVNF